MINADDKNIERSYELNKVEIGKRIQALRIKNKESQQELANAIGISPAAVSAYETGERIPRDEIKLALAEHFKTSVQKIFFS